MEVFIDFSHRFIVALVYTAPLLLCFILIIVALGLLIGKSEGWTRLDAIYFAFITATTVGFGDLCPRRRVSKSLSIMIALLGMIFTGIVIALAIHAAAYTFRHLPEFTEAVRSIEQ